VLHFVQLAPEGADCVLALATGGFPMRAGATKLRGGNQRIAGTGHGDGDLHEAAPSGTGTEKQNGPVQ
jgi:hypothetical protein